MVAEIFAAYLEPGASLSASPGAPAGYGRSRSSRGGKGVEAPLPCAGTPTSPNSTGKVYAGRARGIRPARIRRSATYSIGDPHSSDRFLRREWIFIGRCRRWSVRRQFEFVAQKLSKNKSFARRNNKAN